MKGYFVLKMMQFDRTRVSVIIPVYGAGSKSQINPLYFRYLKITDISNSQMQFLAPTGAESLAQGVALWIVCERILAPTGRNPDVIYWLRPFGHTRQLKVTMGSIIVIESQRTGALFTGHTGKPLKRGIHDVRTQGIFWLAKKFSCSSSIYKN